MKTMRKSRNATAIDDAAAPASPHAPSLLATMERFNAARHAMRQYPVANSQRVK
jgi:hypothetical protein